MYELLAYFLAGSVISGLASALALHWLWMPQKEVKFKPNIRRVK